MEARRTSTRTSTSTSTEPFDAILSAGGWQLATLIVALVVVPGAVDQVEALHRQAGSAPEAAPVTMQWTSRGRAVRPPRAC